MPVLASMRSGSDRGVDPMGVKTSRAKPLFSGPARIWDPMRALPINLQSTKALVFLTNLRSSFAYYISTVITSNDVCLIVRR